jgi:hypothetical protein
MNYQLMCYQKFVKFIRFCVLFEIPYLPLQQQMRFLPAGRNDNPQFYGVACGEESAALPHSPHHKLTNQ